jgi:molecular chaperone GrpE
MEKENDTKNKNTFTSEQDVGEEKEAQNKEFIEPTIEEKFKEVQDKLLRVLADSENQRRRYEKETREAFEYGGFNFARETLSLLDNLHRAHQSIKNDESLKENKDLNKFLENIQIVEKDLVTIFEKNDIKKIDCLNKKFDPNNHQAMLEMEDENVEPGTILQEIQPGYFFKDRLLRPSFVAVAKKKEVKKDEHEEKNNKSTLVEG